MLESEIAKIEHELPILESGNFRLMCDLQRMYMECTVEIIQFTLSAQALDVKCLARCNVIQQCVYNTELASKLLFSIILETFAYLHNHSTLDISTTSQNCIKRYCSTSTVLAKTLHSSNTTEMKRPFGSTAALDVQAKGAFSPAKFQ